jgi:hypothetical protein
MPAQPEMPATATTIAICFDISALLQTFFSSLIFIDASRAFSRE